MTTAEQNQSLFDQGLTVICHPRYLQPLPPEEEATALARRTLFVKFHRAMFRLRTDKIRKIWLGYQHAKWQARNSAPDEYRCDLELMFYAIQYQIALRADPPTDSDALNRLVAGFQENAVAAEALPQIDSDYLLELARAWLHRP